MRQQQWLFDVLARLAPSFKGEITEETPLSEEGLGFDSLGLADLIGEIERELSVEVREEDIQLDNFGTVGRLLRFLESRADSDSRAVRDVREASLLKVLRHGSDRAPFTMVNGDVFGGGALYCLTLARRLGPDQPFYTLSSHGTNGGRIPSTIEEMAADHVRTLRSALPQGPYLLGGYSHGALVAFEMARQLTTAGRRVPLVVIIDMPAADPARAIDFSATRSTAEGFLSWRRRFPRVRNLGRAAKRSVSSLMQTSVRRAGGAPVSTVAEDGEADGAAAVRQAAAWRRTQWDRYTSIVREYIPGPYPGAVTVMVARHGHYWQSTSDRTLGWRRVARSVRTILIPGDHQTSVSKHTATVARHLEGCLAEIRRSNAIP
jgi:thioesterase domain-containing protein/acyl carrier protein